MKTAKIFKHGNSQTVRLPKELRVACDEGRTEQSGSVPLTPTKLSYEQIMAAVARFKGIIARHQP